MAAQTGSMREKFVKRAAERYGKKFTIDDLASKITDEFIDIIHRSKYVEILNSYRPEFFKDLFEGYTSNESYIETKSLDVPLEGVLAIPLISQIDQKDPKLIYSSVFKAMLVVDRYSDNRGTISEVVKCMVGETRLSNAEPISKLIVNGADITQSEEAILRLLDVIKRHNTEDDQRFKLIYDLVDSTLDNIPESIGDISDVLTYKGKNIINISPSIKFAVPMLKHAIENKDKSEVDKATIVAKEYIDLLDRYNDSIKYEITGYIVKDHTNVDAVKKACDALNNDKMHDALSNAIPYTIDYLHSSESIRCLLDVAVLTSNPEKVKAAFKYIQPCAYTGPDPSKIDQLNNSINTGPDAVNNLLPASASK